MYVSVCVCVCMFQVNIASNLLMYTNNSYIVSGLLAGCLVTGCSGLFCALVSGSL